MWDLGPLIKAAYTTLFPTIMEVDRGFPKGKLFCKILVSASMIALQRMFALDGTPEMPANSHNSAGPVDLIAGSGFLMMPDQPEAQPASSVRLPFVRVALLNMV